MHDKSNMVELKEVGLKHTNGHAWPIKCVFGSALDIIDSDKIDFDRIDFERIDLCLDTIM